MNLESQWIAKIQNSTDDESISDLKTNLKKMVADKHPQRNRKC